MNWLCHELQLSLHELHFCTLSTVFSQGRYHSPVFHYIIYTRTHVRMKYCNLSANAFPFEGEGVTIVTDEVVFWLSYSTSSGSYTFAQAAKPSSSQLQIAQRFGWQQSTGLLA